jgi:ABC-type transporter Mla subunit MlaD
MDSRQRELQIGTMVLAALVCLIALMFFFGKQSIVNLGSEYAVKVRFQRTPGISRNSPVFKNGVKIGRVSNVQLVDQDREVEVSILISSGRKLYTNEECRIRQTVIMGEASLEFVKKPNFTGKIEEIDPDKPLVGGIPSDLMSGFSGIESDLTRAINNVADAASQFNEIATRTGDFLDRVNSFIGTPEDLQSQRTLVENTFDEMRATMKSMNQFANEANKFVGDPAIQQNVRKFIADIPELTERSRTLIDESNHFVKEIRTLVERGNVSMDKIVSSIEKAESTLAGVVKITQSVQDDVPELITELKKSAVKLSSFFDEITMIAEGFRNADGTVKRLMRDPAMYEKLLTTLDHIEQIIGEVDTMLRTDVKPITNNVKILTDKAARDPAVFIRNLIRRQPPTKGALPFWGDGLGSDGLDSGWDGGSENANIFFHNETWIDETEIPDADGTIIEEEQPYWQPNQWIETQTRYRRPVRWNWGRRMISFFPILFSPSFLKRGVPEILSVTEPATLPAVPTSSQLLPLPLLRGVREGDQVLGEELIPSEDRIPEEGRVVHADPRYSDEKQPVVQQTSYQYK